MLQSMRNKTKGLVAVFLIGLLTIPLALVGVENLFTGTSNVGEAAEVDGSVITERDVQLAIARERQRLQAQFGDNFPAAFFTDERLRESAMVSLVQRALMVNVAVKGNMTFSDRDINQSIVEQPLFQVAGTFNQQQFEQGVRNLGHTALSFRALLKSDMLANQIQSTIVSSDFITDKEVSQMVALSRQTRDFSWITLPLGDLPKTISVSEEEVAAHYEANKQDYLSVEEVAVEYIDLNIDDISKDITVEESAVKLQYDSIVASYKSSTEREAAHIMIEGSDETAQQKMADVQAKLTAGEDFSTLASDYSDDFGTRDNGGNLGVSNGDAFPEAFEKALLDLTSGQVSEAIEIDGATHFIKLVSVKENSAPSFESQQAKIIAELKRAQAEEQFIQDAQALEDLAYNAESLSEVADELGVNVVKTELFSRANATTIDAILQDGRILEAAFSEQVVNDGHSSDLLNVSSDRVAVVKLLEHKPVRTLTLDEKSEAIISELQLEKAKAQIAEQASSLREALDNGIDIVTLAEQKELAASTQTGAQRNSAGVPEDLLSSVFEMPHPAMAVAESAAGEPIKISLLERHLDNGDYVLVSLSKVTPGDVESLPDAERQSFRSSISSSIAGDEYRAWQAQLENSADVEIYRSQSSAVY
jgi:peptidyl-prolyl cis-trans isomerase D